MKDNAPPEEKLLRLIRGQKKQAPVTDLKPQNPVHPPAGDLKPDFKPYLFFSFRRFLSFLSVRRIILAGFALSCVYLLNSLIYPWVSFKKNRFSVMPPQKINLPALETAGKVKPYEFYLEAVRNKRIFSTAAGGEEAEKTAVSGDPGSIKDLSLVGIIAGESPQAVIEDKKEQKTYYLSKGQYLGAFQVKDIQEGKVILSYGGQNYELHI